MNSYITDSYEVDCDSLSEYKPSSKVQKKKPKTYFKLRNKKFEPGVEQLYTESNPNDDSEFFSAAELRNFDSGEVSSMASMFVCHKSHHSTEEFNNCDQANENCSSQHKTEHKKRRHIKQE